MSSKKVLKVRDPNKPKAPQTAFFFFCSDKRQDTRDKLGPGEHPASEVARILGHKWKSLTEDEKKAYQDRADRDKDRYKLEMSAYLNPKDKVKSDESV